MRFLTGCFIIILILIAGSTLCAQNTIRIHPANFRFFTDRSGKAIVLTGSHTWMRKRVNRQFVPDGWNLEKFNKYLDFLDHWKHNYIRLWMWEQAGDPDIWLKTADGKYGQQKRP